MFFFNFLSLRVFFPPLLWPAPKRVPPAMMAGTVRTRASVSCELIIIIEIRLPAACVTLRRPSEITFHNNKTTAKSLNFRLANSSWREGERAGEKRKAS